MHIHTIQLNIETLEGGIQEMDATEFGAYMSLLVCCYKAGNQLKDDDKRLARMARTSPRTWKRIRPILEEKFIIKNGYWTHMRVRKELEKYQLLCKKNKSNALKRKETNQPVASQSHSQTRANTNNNKQITINYNNKPPLPPLGGIPDFIDREVWLDWVRYRKESLKPLKPTTVTAQIKKLSKWHDEGIDVNEVLNTSIQNSWTGIFKPKQANKHGDKTHGNAKQRIADETTKLLDSIRDESPD